MSQTDDKLRFAIGKKGMFIKMRLEDFFKERRRLAVAFSGGVDSAYLLYAAKTAGCDVHAYFIKTQFQPQFEMCDARQLAEELGVPLTVHDMNILSEKLITENSPLRCYYCKNAILARLWELARADGYDILCDGTNADDSEADRPGMRALYSHGVISPLRLCGLTKTDIRRFSKDAGLFTHDKPSYACLATRIPADTEITPELLGMVERAEDTLIDMGFSDLRVRLIPPRSARLQLPEYSLSAALGRRTEIIKALETDFECVLLDLKGR